MTASVPRCLALRLSLRAPRAKSRGGVSYAVKVVAAGAVVLCVAVLLWPRSVFSHETLTTTVLFDREIVRILDRHCVMCHSADGPSFPLATYEETWLKGRSIRSAVIARHMPPWAAVPGYGEFANDNSLTLRETQFVVSWVEGLGPRNAGRIFLNVQDPGAPRPREIRAEPHVGHWRAGTPDLTREVVAAIDPAEAAVGAGQAPLDEARGKPLDEARGKPLDDARSRPTRVVRSTVDLGLTAPRGLRGLEYMPGNRRVVRAASFTLERTGQWLGSWTPWYGFATLPAGTAFNLPAGSRIVSEIHVDAMAGGGEERGTLGLFLTDARPRTTMAPDLILDGRATAGAPLRVRATAASTADTYAVALRPDIAQGLKSIEVSAKTAQGATQVLLFAKDPPLEWPTPYVFKEPVVLRRGTTIQLTGYFATPADAARGLRVTLSRYVSTAPGRPAD